MREIKFRAWNEKNKEIMKLKDTQSNERAKMKKKKSWNKDDVYRTTKCFSPRTNGYPGGFPVGFMKYLEKNGWIKGKVCFLCSGKAEYPNAVTVDINAGVKPTYCCDARNTGLEPEQFDTIIIDPPYTKELADKLYNTSKWFSSINSFTKEAERLCKPGGLIVTLSYEVPKRIKNTNFIVVIGVYQTISVAHIRCLTVSRKFKEVSGNSSQS